LQDRTDNRPISEIFRLVALQYLDAQSAARLYEETKSSFRAKLIMDTEGKSMAEREMKALASDEYATFVNTMCANQDKALRLKLQMEVIRMRFSEQQSAEASNRKEMGLTR
jgi:hypothetical protein